MDGRDELPLCRQPKKSQWQHFSDFFSQNPFGQILISVVGNGIYFALVGAVGALLYWCRCAPRLTNERRLKDKIAEYKEKLRKLEEELNKDETKPDHSRATSNLFHPPCSGSMDQNQDIISAQPSNSNRRCNSTDNGVEEEDEIKGDTLEQDEIKVEVRINIPESPNSLEVERFAQNSKILRPSPVSIKGSRILVKEVILRDDILDELSGLADVCTVVDDRVTVQLSDCRVFIRTDEGVKQMELDIDRDKLPVILHSSYAAGKLTIEGLNLENAILKAATFDESITLTNVAYKKVENELGVCTWFGQLPSNNCDKSYVYATKTISIQEHKVLVTSSVVKIQDDNLRTVVRFGIPPIILMIFIASQLYQDGRKLIKWLPDLAWIVPLSLVILLPILPPSTENKITEWLEHARLIFLVLNSSTWNFLFKQHPDFEDAINSRRKYEQELSKPFEVVYGLKEKLWSERDYIIIYSPSLIESILQLLIPRLKYASSEEGKEVYASELFHIREKLRVIGLKGVDQVFPGKLQLSEEDREELQIHVGHLLRFMDKELENVLKRYSIMERERHVSWDMLWAFFPVGTQVVYQCAITDEKLLGIVSGVAYRRNDQGGEFLNVDITMWDYNCSTWNVYKTSRSISQFDGDCTFSSLQTYPLRFSDDAEKDEEEFLRRGEVFCELSMLDRNRFMNYSGLIYVQQSVNGCVMLVKEIASGRVMVDLGSFAKMNPNYKMEGAEPPCEVLRDNIVVSKDITTSPERKYSPAMVYGFSFRLKKWGTFQVCSFSEIAFNETAFDADLVMPEQRKVLVEKLVREYMPKARIAQVLQDDASSQQIDPIVSKGEGCTILCYGPSGTGKTLTAESIAEKLHAPLWSLSVSELGTTLDALESYLVKLFDVATTWSAILLLDEVEVRLERDSSGDFKRTARSEIFLRNLEYYRGVLFLTTNRIETFDETFRSHFNLILSYEIDRGARRKIWSTTLSRLNMMNIGDDQLDQFSSHVLNGRDIRNVVHRATILSKNNIGGRLTLENIQQSQKEVLQSLDEVGFSVLEDEKTFRRRIVRTLEHYKETGIL